MTQLYTPKRAKGFYFALMILCFAGCDDGTGHQESWLTESLITPELNVPARQDDSSSGNEPTANADQEQLLEQIHDLEAKLVEANSLKPRLEDAAREINALQEQLNAADSQLNDMQKRCASTAMVPETGVNNDEERHLALAAQHLRLLDTLSELKDELQNLDVKYNESQQQINLLQTELDSYRQRETGLLENHQPN